ncbi:MAG: type I-C CRISPR-associated protein Cas8c/Csd1 [Lachnospiraceae bacterium]|nr:type I-C CRISPR-associated protein Cas8c/Csd1 [Lachnospiraceae bacterium]
MTLQALVKHYENLVEKGKVSREGWCSAKVSYAVNLSSEGKVTAIFSLKEEQERGKKKVEVPSLVTVPEMVVRSSGVSANFLCDNSKYMLGIDSDGTNSRVMECFQAAKERHLALLKNMESEIAQAICRYFETWDPEAASDNSVLKEYWDDITDGGNLIFCMGEVFAHEDPGIEETWNNTYNTPAGDVEGICLVTGKRSAISRIHKTIKGVPGAQSSGAALVSFNAPAFESYGKEQSYNAPVGKYAEFAYTTALNFLLSQREYTFQLGDSMIVFWAESGEEEYQKGFLMFAESKPDNQEEIKGIFESLKNDLPVYVDHLELNPDQRFYILCLAPNAARLSVRFFYQDSFGNILRNISRHYERMEMIKPSWETMEYMGIRQMLFETVNQKSKDKSPVPNMAAMVLQAILSGARYPASLYTDTLIRVRAEQGAVTWGRAAIIKAYLIRNYMWEEGENYMGLNEESKEPAYVLGRLFSVLESIQLDANPGIKATIRDRYFNSACATPASVFPVLIKLKNSHMKKLEREKASSKIYYEQLLTEIIGKLDEYPKRLSLEEQGQFILGYYHQVQRKYQKKEEK